MKNKNDIQFLSDFQLLTEIGYDLSQQFDGIIVDDIIKTKSTHLLAKIIDNCFSLLKLIPNSKLDKVKDGFLDFSSTLSLIRNIIELANQHWYLIIDEASNEEQELKLLIFDYHDTLSLTLIIDNLFYQKSTIDFLNNQLSELKLRIESNNCFKSLDKNKQKMILKGKISSILTQFEITGKRGIDIAEFKSYYKLMSINTHSSPAAIKLFVSEKTHGKENELTKVLLSLSLNYCSYFLASLIKTTTKLWGFKFSNLNSEKIVNNYSWE